MKRTLLLALLLLALTVACSSAEEPTPTPTPLPTFPPPDPTQTLQVGYPPPVPADATLSPDAYPVTQPTAMPEATGYPDDARAWLLKPAGAQCQDYTVDLRQAVAELRAAGIEVYNSQVTNLIVCEACDNCPSSEHYRVLIDTGQVPAAEDLGWERE